MNKLIVISREKIFLKNFYIFKIESFYIRALLEVQEVQSIIKKS